jgi:Fe-S cluster assembly iron-binding protein IscA
VLTFTEAATEVLKRAYEASARFNPTAKVRISKRGDEIDTGFADEPLAGDQLIEHAGLTVIVESGIEGTLDVSSEHERLVLRPRR